MIDKELMELVESIQQLYEQAFMFYSPIVEELCNRNDVSQKELEYELDGMLLRIYLTYLKGFAENFISNIQKLLQVIS